MDQDCSNSNPEISVHSTPGILINSGDDTPSDADGTVYQSANIGGGVRFKSFYVVNEGNAALNLTGITPVWIGGPHDADFFVSYPLDTLSIMPGEMLTVSIGFRPLATGIRTAIVNIQSNDQDEDPYTFTIQGTGTGTDNPEIAVKNMDGVVILNNDTTPSVGDGTDFGSLDTLGGGSLTRTFQIIQLWWITP